MPTNAPRFTFGKNNDEQFWAEVESPEQYQLFVIFFMVDCLTIDLCRSYLEAIYELQRGRITHRHTRAGVTNLSMTQDAVNITLLPDKLTDSPYHGQVQSMSLENFGGLLKVWRINLQDEY